MFVSPRFNLNSVCQFFFSLFRRLLQFDLCTTTTTELFALKINLWKMKRIGGFFLAFSQKSVSFLTFDIWAKKIEKRRHRPPKSAGQSEGTVLQYFVHCPSLSGLIIMQICALDHDLNFKLHLKVQKSSLTVSKVSSRQDFSPLFSPFFIIHY